MAVAVGAAVIVVRLNVKPPRARGRRYDGHESCPGCGAHVGFRWIRKGMRVLAAHSHGRARVIRGEPTCIASELNTEAA